MPIGAFYWNPSPEQRDEINRERAKTARLRAQSPERAATRMIENRVSPAVRELMQDTLNRAHAQAQGRRFA
jgi:hypothetical protein